MFKEIRFNDKSLLIEDGNIKFIEDIKILSKGNDFKKVIIKFNKDEIDNKALYEFINDVIKLCEDKHIKFDFKPFVNPYSYNIPKLKVGAVNILKDILPKNWKIRSYLIDVRKRLENRVFLLNSLPFASQGKLVLEFNDPKVFNQFLALIKSFQEKYYVVSNKSKVDELIIKEMSKRYYLTHKFYKVNNVKEKAYIIANIIKSGGLLSKEIRRELMDSYCQGIGNFDELGGGSDYVFFRLSKYSDEDDLVFDLNLLNDGEYIIHDADRWGDILNDSKNRVNLKSINSTYVGEVLVKHIAPISYLKCINVDNESEKQELIKELKNLGINNINGKPLKEVIQVSQRNRSIKKKLMLSVFKIYNLIEGLDNFRVIPKIMKLIYDKFY
jgi:hypothetical protein